MAIQLAVEFQGSGRGYSEKQHPLSLKYIKHTNTKTTGVITREIPNSQHRHYKNRIVTLENALDSQ